MFDIAGKVEFPRCQPGLPILYGLSRRQPGLPILYGLSRQQSGTPVTQGFQDDSMPFRSKPVEYQNYSAGAMSFGGK